MTVRFYYESDGNLGNKTYYVVDAYADPLGDQKRTDCDSRGDARSLARCWNESPPWPPWDIIQAERDRYLTPFLKGTNDDRTKPNRH